MSTISAGSPHPLGATSTGHGVNFALFSRHAQQVELCLIDSSSGQEHSAHSMTRSAGDIWHIALGSDLAAVGTCYAFRVHGPVEPAEGHRFDSDRLLVDPYARELVLAPRLCGRVRDANFDWGADRPPSIPWRDSFVYELHVKGFTQRHPHVPADLRGTYRGLASAAAIDHLRSIGVTAVELLPVQAFVSEEFLRQRGLSNYWGYNSLAWFAPAAQYAVHDPVVEFKTMVKALHAAGIEVILDVVFNHTAEGNESGPTLSLRGIDNSVYYRLLREDKRYYENLTGCGNTLNCQHPVVRTLVIDCLKYWVEEMHVDGFRFDLAPVLAREDNGFNERSAFFDAIRAEPSLAYVKLIAEPWDVGLGGYQLGRFPPGWSEWNDRFRDTIRAFWNTEAGRLGDLAERLAGSSDIFRHRSRKPSASLNFIAAHDGFTLRDLVSYDHRHNEANQENGADGHSHNLSWNCGAEGDSDDAAVQSLRLRQMKNFLATVLLSQGVPMLQAGDEFARTQGGNNNAYCQDNEISWIDWSFADKYASLLSFVRRLTQIRREYPVFRRETFLKGGARRAGSKDVSWLSVRGGEMTEADWQEPSARVMGIKFVAPHGMMSRVLLLVNAGFDAAEFPLPASAETGWRLLFDTAREPGVENCEAPACVRDVYRLESHSMVLLEA